MVSLAYQWQVCAWVLVIDRAAVLQQVWMKSFVTLSESSDGSDEGYSNALRKSGIQECESCPIEIGILLWFKRSHVWISIAHGVHPSWKRGRNISPKWDPSVMIEMGVLKNYIALWPKRQDLSIYFQIMIIKTNIIF